MKKHSAPLEPPRNVYLVGFMGSGKTSVGKALARRLAWMFHDTDRTIERRAQKSVAQIFDSLGEGFFRAAEREEIARVSRGKHVVAALGGGAVLDYRNLDVIERTGAVVYLRVSAKEALRRIEAEGVARRPLLSDIPSEEREKRLALMLRERKPLYERAALRVTTTGRTPEDIARRIERKLFPKKTDARA